VLFTPLISFPLIRKRSLPWVTNEPKLSLAHHSTFKTPLCARSHTCSRLATIRLSRSKQLVQCHDCPHVDPPIQPRHGIKRKRQALTVLTVLERARIFRPKFHRSYVPTRQSSPIDPQCRLLSLAWTHFFPTTQCQVVP
jgi:hypothetical protein